MWNRRTVLYAATLAVMSPGLNGCARSSSYPGLEVEPREWTFVEVTNHNWSDVKIYAIRGSSKFRLGSVGSFATERLRVPPVAIATNELRLRVEIIGSRVAYTTEPFLVNAGATVDWVINTHLPLSSLAIQR